MFRAIYLLLISFIRASDVTLSTEMAHMPNSPVMQSLDIGAEPPSGDARVGDHVIV